MIRNMFLGKKNETSESAAKTAQPPFNLLVIQEDAYDWSEIFKGCSLPNGRELKIAQAGWKDIVVGPVDNYSRNRCMVSVRKNDKGKQSVASFNLDFVLIRNEVYTPNEDYRWFYSLSSF